MHSGLLPLAEYLDTLAVEWDEEARKAEYLGHTGAAEEYRIKAQKIRSAAALYFGEEPGVVLCFQSIPSPTVVKVWLDAEVPAPEGWVWTKRAQDAWDILARHHVDEMSLAYDLGKGELTGYALLAWMEEYGLWPEGSIQIHCNVSDTLGRMQAILNRRARM